MLGCSRRDLVVQRGGGGWVGYPLFVHCNGTCDLTKLEMSAYIAVRCEGFFMCCALRMSVLSWNIRSLSAYLPGSRIHHLHELKKWNVFWDLFNLFGLLNLCLMLTVNLGKITASVHFGRTNQQWGTSTRFSTYTKHNMKFWNMIHYYGLIHPEAYRVSTTAMLSMNASLIINNYHHTF